MYGLLYGCANTTCGTKKVNKTDIVRACSDKQTETEEKFSASKMNSQFDKCNLLKK